MKRLGELGWIDGRTVAIEYRWAQGQSERFADIAAEFVKLKVDVIVTGGDSTPRSKAGNFDDPDCVCNCSERLGQQFVIENRPGAGGNIATEAVVRSPADGSIHRTPSMRRFMTD